MRNKNTVTKYIGIFHCKNWPIKRCQSYRKLFDFLIIHIAETIFSARLAQSVEHETVKFAAVSSSALGDTLFPYYWIDRTLLWTISFCWLFYLDPWLTLTLSIQFAHKLTFAVSYLILYTMTHTDALVLRQERSRNLTVLIRNYCNACLYQIYVKFGTG